MKTVLEASSARGPEKGTSPTSAETPSPCPLSNSPTGLWCRKTTIVATCIAAILVHLLLRFGFHTTARSSQVPLRITLISRRMRFIALQSAVGGMALSVIGRDIAAAGHLNPVSGAIAQEVIDVLAVLNALRAAFPPKVIHDI